MADANGTFSGAPAFQPGRPLSASALEKLRQADQRILPSRGLGVMLRQTAQGTIISVPRQRRGKNAALGRLVLTLTRPDGDSEDKDANKGWITWGHVNSMIISNIATSYALVKGLKVYVKVTTNGRIPLKVLSAEITTTTETPEDKGGTISTPPTTAYYLLGQVGGAGTQAEPFYVTNAGTGNLSLGVRAIGYSCVLATPGDPSATPPVPPTPGGVKTDYELKWERVA